MDRNTLTRRAFLACATTTAVVTAFRVNAAQVVPRKLSPNEKLRVAGIGAGGKGLEDVMSCARDRKRVDIVALADPDWKRCAEAFYRLKDAKQYKDYRKMLEEMGDQIDACTVSTPDHTHAPAAYMAMKMGKHVYVQKPLTHTIAEARLLRQVAAETGVITMMGNQGHCGDGVRELCEMIWSGAIGKVREAHIWTNRPVWPQGIADPLPEEPVPETMDWELWIGAAPFRPYNSKYAPFNWRGWWDFGCGAIGDMACHIMDPANWALGLSRAESFTVEVVTQEGMTSQTYPLKSTIKFSFPARQTDGGAMEPVTVYWYDGGLKPPRPEGVPEGEKLGDGDNGSLFIGTDGMATAGEYGGDARLLPASRMKEYTPPPQTLERIPRGNPYLHWIDCIYASRKAVSDFSYAGPLTEMANFGNIALKAGEPVSYDCVNGKITSNEALNKLLTKEYRKGWELPC
ncbi:MAG TPA: Gfo/Idh/MocA family oxidoreductase [Candidatus Hydrogenedentes bacterium]|nr:Gfo/Idh/MocA family oxidoreductase [Candidatus Hydrogenedentota bacterium]HOK88999.1 Gfo/Idh/MocA family oxidoreductase [Candidatus Hydrogenedentota bacterium]